jgi:uncharacterized lipoprotein NlpE involved in copper resistance
MRIITTLLLTLTLVACGSNPVKHENALTGEQIKQLLTGKTASYVNRKGWSVENTFNTDGSASLKYLSGKFAGDMRNNNSWAVNGNEMCYTLKHNNKTACGKLLDNGDGTYNRLNADGSLRVVFKSVK